MAADIISTIQDPEKPFCLEQLEVVQEDLVEVRYFKPGDGKTAVPLIQITWVPTVPNCHLAMTIALSIRAKLAKKLPELGADLAKCKIEILVQHQKHDNKEEIDKQVNDKERVFAALENPHIRDAIEDLIRMGGSTTESLVAQNLLRASFGSIVEQF